MNSLVLLVLTIIGYVVAYNTYGKWISNKVFKLNNNNEVPSKKFEDGIDYVPTKKHILLGHHFTTISGTGPIVGPAIGIIWGWVPAFIWVFFGSIFMGAVHDVTTLIVSSRNEGKSIGEVTKGLINNRTSKIFLIVMQFLLWILVSIFAFIIALLFKMYPMSVIPVWTEIPIAIWLSYMIYKKGKNDIVYSIIAVVLMYATIIVGVFFPIVIPGVNATYIWIAILLVYVFFASTLPVHKLLQPRDYINSHQLVIAMGLLALGIIVGHPKIVAPAFYSVADAPPMFPILFITIACGAISGFHSLASSGTTVKQMEKETDAHSIGYGAMILEGMLAVVVIIAIGAGLGMNGGGASAFTSHYISWAGLSGLEAKLAAVIEGSANLMNSYGIPIELGKTIMAVFIVSFAGTTLDSATRIQRFTLQELFSNKDGKIVKPLDNRYVATASVLVLAVILILMQPGGKGAMILWPVLGAMNQLLASLGLFVVTIYLAKKNKACWMVAIPMVFMFIVTLMASQYNFKNFIASKNYLLIGITLVNIVIALWIIGEGIAVVIKKKNKEVIKVEE